MIGERIKSRLKQIGMSQAELARQVNLSQPAMNSLVRGRSRSSVHLHRIARVLRTTPAFLEGEIDDPDEGAPPPPPVPRVQLVTLPVALPSEAALEAAFGALLMVSREMDEGELAHELAIRLPLILRAAEGGVAAPPLAAIAAPLGADQGPADDLPAPKRASRR